GALHPRDRARSAPLAPLSRSAFLLAGTCPSAGPVHVLSSKFLEHTETRGRFNARRTSRMTSTATVAASPPDLLRRLESLCRAGELGDLATRLGELAGLVAPDIARI